jgi:dTDP-glucose 4,6-dehydratase
MRVLVTGGAGFIGSHFVRHLVAQGDVVVVLDKLTYSGNRANLDGVPHGFVQGDIADPAAVAAAGEGCEAVVNFAAESHVDRSILDAEAFLRTDILGTHCLLEWARAADARFVQVSTDEVYGDMPEDASALEGDPLRPSSPYSASKAGGDLMAIAYCRTFSLDASITRGANTYGSRQYPEKLIPLVITNALDREPLPVYGDGGQRREWLHVEDHCSAIDRILRHGRAGEVYNIGGEERVNLDVVRRIVDLTGVDPSLIRQVEDRPGHDRRYSVDSTRISALGWAPKRSFEQGLAETVEWYRDHRAWWEPIKTGQYREYYEAQYSSLFSD